MADVGTDHGLLPIYIAGSGLSGEIFASDIRSGPLDIARANAEKYGVSDKITFSLADGLDACPPRGVDTVVIAGMGGETIAGILSRAEWAISDDVMLVLQPQTKRRELESWLFSAGAEIFDAAVVEDSGKLYMIICCRRGTGRADSIDVLCTKKDRLLPAFLDREIRIYSEAVAAAERAGDSRRPEKLAADRAYLDRLADIRGEIEKW